MNDWIQRKPLRLQGYDYSRPGYYFVTVCTALRGQDILSTIHAGDGLCPAPPNESAGPTPESAGFSPVVELTPIGRVVGESIRGIPQRYAGVTVDSHCIMPDHVHLIIHLSSVAACETGRDRARPLQRIIGAMKSYTDRQYRLSEPAETKLWQVSFYDHIIRSESDLRNTREYIQNNPRKWILN